MDMGMHHTGRTHHQARQYQQSVQMVKCTHRNTTNTQLHFTNPQQQQPHRIKTLDPNPNPRPISHLSPSTRPNQSNKTEPTPPDPSSRNKPSITDLLTPPLTGPTGDRYKTGRLLVGTRTCDTGLTTWVGLTDPYIPTVNTDQIPALSLQPSLMPLTARPEPKTIALPPITWGCRDQELEWGPLDRIS